MSHLVHLRAQVGSRPDQTPTERQVRMEVPTMEYPGSHTYCAVDPNVVVVNCTRPFGMLNNLPQLIAV